VILNKKNRKMVDENIVNATKSFVKNQLKNAEGGHDWFHTERVYNSALQIAKGENANALVVALAALLHDVADSKFHDGDETLGPKIARTFLETQKLNVPTIEHIIDVIENSSFKGGNFETKFNSIELQIVQDADRLDAIGAIGIARAFNFGGFKNRGLYDPEIQPNLLMTKEEYKKSNAPTINHFYEKLLLLKDKMNTQTGRELAEGRHKFLEMYLEQFYKEWEGKR
jgi:uncharacterized protein